MRRLLFLLLLIIAVPGVSRAYSVLTHEAIIDASWKSTIEPLLLQKFPKARANELIEAHAYAYGGSIVPDIGYYPFGSKLFTNLVHNVRTGDFVMSLIEEARTLNEYAFAIGALSHYMADNYGHSIATNAVVPLAFSKIRSKYGSTVTYADHKKSHSRIEFGFDLIQMARENYASMSHRDFIGFKVSKEVLKKAVLKTYGLNINDVFSNLSLAVTSLRWCVKTIFPTVVKASLINKKAQITKTDAGSVCRDFSTKMKKKVRVHQHDYREEPGAAANLISAILPFLPKIGPLAKLRFRSLSAEAERLFVSSFDTTLVHYAASLAKLRTGELYLANRILDTGHEAVAGEYAITDSNYKELLRLLTDQNYDNLTAGAKKDLISFYSRGKTVKAGKQSEIHTLLTMLENAPVKGGMDVLRFEDEEAEGDPE